MEASLRFYLDGLGMQHAFSLANKENRPWIEYLCVAPGQFIELFYPEGKAVEEDTRYMHLCLQIDDLPAYVAQLREDVYKRQQKGLPAFGIYGHDVQDADATEIPADVQEKILRFARAGLAVATMRGKSYLSMGNVCLLYTSARAVPPWPTFCACSRWTSA